MLPLKCRNISHTTNYFPQTLSLMVVATPQELAAAKALSPLCLTLESFPAGDRRPSIYVPASAHVHVHTQAQTCTQAYTYVPFVVHQKLKEIKKALPRTRQVHILQSPNEWASLCLLTGVREECFLRDYYNHRHGHCYHCYLLLMMVLII